MVPLRFFLTLPGFGMLAAATLGWGGVAAWDGRYSNALLATVHLMTLGFLTLAMAGALLQLLPVVAGVPVPRARVVSAAVHGLLVCGTLLLALGLARPDLPVLGYGLLLLLAAFGIFLPVMGYCLVRAVRTSTVLGMRLAMIALALTVLLGTLLALSRLGHPLLMSAHLTDLHLAWGLLGWVGLLVTGVAYQVVPMFQITPAYPRWLQRGLAPLWLLALAGMTVAPWLPAADPWRHALTNLASLALALGYAAFAIATLVLLQRRRRRVVDVTLYFWRLASASVLACVALGGTLSLWPDALRARLALSWGVLALVGAAASVVNGMLYKIVPFLVWLHLQRHGGRGRLTNMKEIIPDAAARRQWLMHLIALGLLLAAAWRPREAAGAAALVFGYSCLLLALNLAGAYTLYRRLTTRE
jgi:hypothetical protein